jgi:hypothetical protein
MGRRWSVTFADPKHALHHHLGGVVASALPDGGGPPIAEDESAPHVSLHAPEVDTTSPTPSFPADRRGTSRP